MIEKFSVMFLREAGGFMNRLNIKSREKIYYNIRKAQVTEDPVLFKKLNNTIWEFRTLYNKIYYRLFAFWDTTDKKQTLVFITHGMIKKTGKAPASDLDRAARIRLQYAEQKAKDDTEKKKIKNRSTR